MIVFEHVSKVFGPADPPAVDDLCLEVAEGETLVLLGSSGSGKTTTLKMVNRLIEPTSGRILIEGEDIMAQPAIALRRRIGYAIQHIGLFPHMTVGENIATVPQLLGWPGDRIRERVDSLLGMVGLEPEIYRDRFPLQLSGGQRQRVGVARSLAADPPIVLMDEPFGALDPITREQLQEEFLELESEIKKTVLFVTHDMFEAARMGDRIALMNEGRIQQLASPAELVEHPANEFVESFLGQHRFQLSLLTRTLRQILPEALPEEPEEAQDAGETRLSPRSSLINALDEFKKSGRESLPVYQRGRQVARLEKRELIRHIAEVLGETGVEA